MRTGAVCRIVLGDAYQEIQKIKDQSIDLIITDPPYDMKAHEKRQSNDKISKSIGSVMKELRRSNLTEGIDYAILEEFVRVLKKINIYIFCNKKQILPYLNFFVERHKCSFEILVWIKSNPVPNCGNMYLIDKEYCLFFRKGVRMNMTYQRAHTYWITATNKKDKLLYHHPTVKPQQIIEQLILNSSNEGEVILDPFLGSGTTAAAAVKWNRQFIGFERNAEYYNTAKRRVNDIGR